MSNETVVRTVKNHTVPEGVSIFPHIRIETAELQTRNYVKPKTEVHILMMTWVPVITDAVYLIPLIYRRMDIKENKEKLLKETKAQFLAEVKSIQSNYMIDEKMISNLDTYFMYPENKYYKMEY